jgi:hypothetical protein
MYTENVAKNRTGRGDREKERKIANNNKIYYNCVETRHAENNTR